MYRILNITSHPAEDLAFLIRNETISVLSDEESGEIRGANWNGHEGFPDDLYAIDLGSNHRLHIC